MVACLLAVVADVMLVFTLFFSMVQAPATKALALHFLQEIRVAWFLRIRSSLSITLLMQGVDVHRHGLCAMRL